MSIWPTRKGKFNKGDKVVVRPWNDDWSARIVLRGVVVGIKGNYSNTNSYLIDFTGQGALEGQIYYHESEVNFDTVEQIKKIIND